MFPGLNDHRDIVLIDQRGTGGSNAIEYPALPDVADLSASDNTIALTPSVIGGWLQGSLQDGYQTAALPKDIHAVYRSIQSVQANQATGQQNQEASSDPLQVMRWEIMCSEYWARRNLQEVARLSTGTLFEEWALDDARQQDAICRFMPRGIVEPEEGARVISRVPALILNGEADPMDPPAHVINAEREQPNSLTLIVPGAAHTVGHLGCLPKVVTEFIQRGSAAGLEAGCVEDYQPPPFEFGE